LIHFVDDTTIEFQQPPDQESSGNFTPRQQGRIHFPAGTTVTFPVTTKVYYANGTGTITHAAGSSAYIVASTKIDVYPSWLDGGQIRFSACTIIEFQYCYKIHFLDDSVIEYLGKGFNLYTGVQDPIFVAQDIDVVKNQAFARIGNVNYPGGWGNNFGWYRADRIIDADDRYRVAMATPTSAWGPWGHGELKYNPDADFNGDTAVNIIDKVIVNINYRKTAG